MARWVGGLLIGAGVLALAIAGHAAQTDANERRTALAQASYAQGKCTVRSSEVIDWRHDTPDGVDRGSTIETTFVVHAPTGDVPDVTYRYSDGFWTPPAARNAVATTHRPGATIACFYDAAKPSNAVLVQRAVPEPGTSPWVPGGIVSGVLFVFGLVMLLVKPDRRRHVDA